MTEHMLEIAAGLACAAAIVLVPASGLFKTSDFRSKSDRMARTHLRMDINARATASPRLGPVLTEQPVYSTLVADASP